MVTVLHAKALPLDSSLFVCLFNAFKNTIYKQQTKVQTQVGKWSLVFVTKDRLLTVSLRGRRRNGREMG